MGEYLVPVVVISAVLGIISYVSYPTASEKTVKFAASVLLLYTALTPVLTMVSDFTSEDISDYLDRFTENEKADGEYEQVASDAFKEGISKLLFTKYDIKTEDAEIYIFGFDFSKMRADKIKILLKNSGVFSDFRAIEEYITESGLGECEVNIRIG